MSIFNDIEQQLIDIDDEWLEYPYCKSVYAVVEESGYEILVYAQRTCDTDIYDLEITDVNYNGKSIGYDFFPKIYKNS